MSQPSNTSNAAEKRHARQVAIRVAIAVFLGYALANSLGILLAWMLPMAKSDGVMTGILLSFPLYAAAAIWVFSVRSLRKACLGLLLPTLVCGLLILALHLAGLGPLSAGAQS